MFYVLQVCVDGMVLRLIMLFDEGSLSLHVNI